METEPRRSCFHDGVTIDDPPACFPPVPEHYQPPSNPMIDTSPGWWWFVNPGHKKYDYDSNGEWGKTARGWQDLRRVKAVAMSTLTSALKQVCVNCDRHGAPCDRKPPVFVIKDSRSGNASLMFSSDGTAWWHAGCVRLAYNATCNVNMLCDSCNASCAVTWQIWDGWHWGTDPANPRTVGGPYEFNWYITWYDIEFISGPCRKGDS